MCWTGSGERRHLSVNVDALSYEDTSDLSRYRTKYQGCSDLIFWIRYVSDSGSRTWMWYMVNSQVHSALIYTQTGFM